jgi:hypothetical protein
MGVPVLVHCVILPRAEYNAVITYIELANDEFTILKVYFRSREGERPHVP